MNWHHSSAAADLVDEPQLQALDDDLRLGAYGQVDSMLVVRNDSILFDAHYHHDYAALSEPLQARGRYFDASRFPYHVDGMHTMQSVTKSVVGALFGIGIDRGDIPGVDTPMLEFFGPRDLDHMGDHKRALTLEHLLMMRAGFDWDESSVTYSHPDNDCARMETSHDWVAFAANRPVIYAPGSHFCYNSGVSQILSHVFHAATGRTIDDYARQHLFEPLGISNLHWDLTPGGLPDTEGGLFLHAHDLARIGRLYLRGGDWDGHRILSSAWVAASTRPAPGHLGGVHVDGRSYGYQWWLLPVQRAGSTDWIWTGLGFGGQRLFVVPWLDLITVFTGWNIYGAPGLAPSVFLQRVLPAVRDGLELRAAPAT